MSKGRGHCIEYLSAIFTSNFGPIMRQGPHQSAKKSITTSLSPLFFNKSLRFFCKSFKPQSIFFWKMPSHKVHSVAYGSYKLCGDGSFSITNSIWFCYPVQTVTLHRGQFPKDQRWNKPCYELCASLSWLRLSRSHLCLEPPGIRKEENSDTQGTWSYFLSTEYFVVRVTVSSSIPQRLVAGVHSKLKIMGPFHVSGA